MSFSKRLMTSKFSLAFANSVRKAGLPIDPNPQNALGPRRGVFFSEVKPTPLKNVRLAAKSSSCFNWIGLKVPETSEEEKELAEVLSGNTLLPESDPLSHCYCGHQFGVFAGQLGDGRAISLGDVRSPVDGGLLDLQLKGAGLTPYSRRADGRAVLRSSIREFLCSEAMYALGIPTSRAASLVVSDTTVARDKLYTGDVRQEKCAVVLRVAPTFIRFGSFEVFKGRDAYSGEIGPSRGEEKEMLPQLLDYVLTHFYSHLSSEPEPLLQMFKEITTRTAELVALWQSYGFCHGVLNTDNMSISGLTIDYGPFAWMENFDPDFICNHSDRDRGRYRYKAQPEICKWNLEKLAEAWSPLVDHQAMKKVIEEVYDSHYNKTFYQWMAQKLGFLITSSPSENLQEKASHRVLVQPQPWKELREDQRTCIDLLFEAMAQTGSDFTETFLALAEVPLTKPAEEVIEKLTMISAPLALREKQQEPSFSPAQMQRIEQLYEESPHMLPMFGIEIKKAEAELAKFKAIKERVRNPYDPVEKQKEMDKRYREIWGAWMEVYQASLVALVPDGLSVEEFESNRRASMGRVNPSFILRNYLMEEAIKKAEDDDFSAVHELLEKALNPFAVSAGGEEHPSWRFGICISCSS